MSVRESSRVSRCALHPGYETAFQDLPGLIATPRRGWIAGIERSVTTDMTMTPQHLAELKAAKDTLEHPSLAVKITSLLGKPIERGFELLPKAWNEKIGEVTREALMAAMKGAVMTMREAPALTEPTAARRWHKAAVALSGAAGGAFGLPALVIELPLSTTIICRSIADIARANGESPQDLATRLACLEVFALGGAAKGDDAAETGYFAVRASLAQAVSEAAHYLASHKLAGDGAPALLRLIGLIAARFKLQVSEKLAAQAVPVVGAAAGAMINLLFIDHFQEMSRGHFTVRRLERLYPPALVRREYEQM